jgi:hypothetical protein
VAIFGHNWSTSGIDECGPQRHIHRTAALGDGIQRICDGRWDPSAESDNSKSKQATDCMDLEHCRHGPYLEPTTRTTIGAHYTVYTWSLVHGLHLEPTRLVYRHSVYISLIALTWSIFTVSNSISAMHVASIQ